MNAQEQIKKFHEFFETEYYAELLEKVRIGEKFLVIDFSKLVRLDLELAELLLEQPEEILKAAEKSLEQFDLPGDVKNFRVRVKNLFTQQTIMIKDIRSEHIGKFLTMVGLVRQKSDVRPQVTVAKFECPSCGNIISVYQVDTTFKEPSRCGCGRKGKFKLIDKELVDAQRLVLEESPEDLEGGEQPKRITVFLRGDLVSPLSERKTNPGSKIAVVGQVKEVPVTLRTGTKSTTFDLMIEANYVEAKEESYADIQITDEEGEKIKELANDKKIYEKLVKSLAPSIYGHERVKEALLLQMFSGVRKKRDDGSVIRGDIHILLVGDPGAGKCIASDTRIVLEDGSVTTIGASVNAVLGNDGKISSAEYFKNTNHDLLSMNLDGKVIPTKATAVWKRRSPKHLYEIKTRCGRNIITTGEHPFFVPQNAMIVAKDAANLASNDFIAAPNIIKVNGARQKIDFVIERTPARNGVHIKLPNEMDAGLARLIGYLVGDGHAYFTQTSAMISLTNNNGEVLSDFSALISNLFSITTTERNSHKGKAAKEAYVCNIELGRLLLKLDETLYMRAKDKRIPSIIMKSPNSILAEFLRAYFECEAHVNVNRRMIEVQSASKNLTEDVQTALLRFGIISQINSGMKCATNTEKRIMRRYWRLSISGEMVNKFNKIGFVSAKKKGKLEELLRKKVKRNTNVQIIPCGRELLSTLRKLLKMNQNDFGVSRSTYEHYDVGDRNPSKENILKVIRVLEKRFAKVGARLSETESEFIDVKIKQLRLFAEADIFWDRAVSVKKIKSRDEWVYDLQVDGVHNFIANNIFVHNSQLLKRVTNVAPKARYIGGKGVSGAGLTAAVVRDEFLKGWSLEAGALALTNKGICCTTGDAGFITEDYKKITFEELFRNSRSDFIYPDFKVLALDTRTNTIRPFAIKRAFRKKNNSAIVHIKTRTGKELKLTEDNEVLTSLNSDFDWVEIGKLSVGDYIASPRHYALDQKDNHPEEFAYVCGLIASDGSIKIDKRRAHTSFYNSNAVLIDVFKKNLEALGIGYSAHVQKKGRKSSIRGRVITSKKDVFNVYNSRKDFAKKLIGFGVPAGNKSIKNALSRKILSYSKTTLASFMRGIFDGDGSIRKNPFEITITTGIFENAKLFQGIFLRLGIISSLKKSAHSWHCDIRGTAECSKFFDIIGSSHPKKFERLSNISGKQVKDRLDILPNHQQFFKKIISKYRWKLGKNLYRYFWKYTKKNVSPSKYKLKELNKFLGDKELGMKVYDDIFWDKIISIDGLHEDYVYDFTMASTNNFVANDLIMHNCIDELDKMSKEDRDAMHEALEQQTISIAKANIQATLRAETTVLAAANPKLGRFDLQGKSIAEQIDLPPTLISRFDLIFPIKDFPMPQRDEEMAKFILRMHQTTKVEDVEIDTKSLRRYIAYARRNMVPTISESAFEEIKNYYVEMRGKGSSEDGVKSIPITARQLEALVRLSEAGAKARLSSVVQKKDARRAIDLVHYCLEQVGRDAETGKFDIDRISTGISAMQRSKISIIKEIITEMENLVGKQISVIDITKKAVEKGIREEDVDEVIEKLKRSGDLYEPRRGIIQRM